MKVTLEVTDTEVRMAIAEYMQKRYPNANRYGLQFYRWQPRVKQWSRLKSDVKVIWETHVG